MIHYSIYERFKALKLRPTHQAMREVGLVIRDLYIHKFGVKPAKRSVELNDNTMEVNIYPDSFIGKVDEQIKHYYASHQPPKNNKAAKSKTASLAQTKLQVQPATATPVEKPTESSAADDRSIAGSRADPVIGHPSESQVKRERKRIMIKKVEPIIKNSTK